ncbi:MAG TPA: hypothetical protein VFL36_06925 [Myxococcales bacterium]|nr:hypothetical protein [Myxococcales bacterium]
MADDGKIRTRLRIADPHASIDDLAETAVMIASELPQIESACNAP